MKIAIVKLSALGDIVHAMVALQFVKQALPQIEIDWLVEERFAGVLQDNPDINQILTVNLKSLKANKLNLFSEIKKLRKYAKNNYDLVIDAQGLIKSAITARLLSAKPLSANSAGFDKNSSREKAAAYLYKNTVASPYDANTIDRNVAVIAKPLGFEISEQQILNKAAFIFYKESDEQLNQYFKKDQANILFVIGSTWASRNYPKEQYLKVIQGLNANSLIIWGNEQEQQSAQWIAERSDKAKVLPKLDFNQLKMVLARSDLVIGNDTGPTHMAWGLNKPSITLFGPTPVSRVYQTPINKVIKSPSIVNPLKLNKNDFSIKAIKVQAIIDLAQSLLGHN
ncbi:MAG: lipopolysaccharide heptosyltransferase I [Methylococcales bacterium]|nr:lipopolysaccharide heptosyltransferase I [Methylococcales bacterium]